MQHIALVTGASTELGEASVRRFLAHDHRVIALDAESSQLEDMKLSLPVDQQQKILTLSLDMSDAEQVDELIASLLPEFSAVTVLVNNASLTPTQGQQREAQQTDWSLGINRNIKGLVHVTRILLPGMVERQCGHVINVGAVGAQNPCLGGDVYGGTKAFFQQFSLNLRADLIGTAVRVSSIHTIATEKELLSANDVAESIFWVSHLPHHMNINRLELMPATKT
ncbi:SDR family NAD(P)-dependent oxidoreductase [Polynucleobacter antarcticus]|uniref:NADP-dependent 3-hydroxy acid dehydrogenase n=1 Tax=Polynucleobacter antarcticus TaxID=1743162 RepID=A0A6M9PPB7_9BURK|nr:SDR family NAD(P)-dependent oxidoreductase [Polynucleobacter antarcticus]QKM62261.1 NADP-dependent 3-hydroxy acid dehydrogenase [Polynucleobacter antarcticus]